MMRIIAGTAARLGAATGRFFGMLGDLSLFSARILKWTFKKPFRRKVYEFRDVIFQAEVIGVQSLFIVGLISILIGMILSFQIAHTLRGYNQEWLMPGIVAIILARELGPLMTAIIIIGRVGSAFTAEIGTMKTHEELLALETMAVNPVGYLVAPRFLAMLIMLPALSTIALLIGLFGAFIVATANYGISAHDFIDIARMGLEPRDLTAGFIKSIVFGAAIVLISCYEAFSVEGGAEGVGRATMASVVNSIILVVVADLFFTGLLNMYFA